jgi:hypothetical protein
MRRSGARRPPARPHQARCDPPPERLQKCGRAPDAADDDRLDSAVLCADGLGLARWDLGRILFEPRGPVANRDLLTAECPVRRRSGVHVELLLFNREAGNQVRAMACRIAAPGCQ